MSNLRFVLSAAALALLVSNAEAAAPRFKVIYHEPLDLSSTAGSGGHQHVHFQAYGRDFDIDLQPNPGVGQAVPGNRADIQPLQGTLAGKPGSWVRLTRARSGWRGMLSDGQELYSVEPAAEVAEVAAQPVNTSSPTTPVMYRLADAVMSVNSGFCGTSADEGSGSDSGDTTTAQAAYQNIAAGLSADAPTTANVQLLVGVVADNAFYNAIGDDPEGAIVARMNVVDGIFSAQVGVHIALAPLVIYTTADEPFTSTTDPSSLLTEVQLFRGARSSQLATGATHLMTGKNLDGTIVGIAYQGTVCNGASAASLSEGTHSTTESALITAHELGHNFNAVHDGVAGVCSSIPQNYIMAPMINFSSQFSSCSLQQMSARMATAACLTPVSSKQAASTASSSTASTSTTSGADGGAGGGGRVDLVSIVFLLAMTTASVIWKRSRRVPARVFRRSREHN